jgi:CRP-like cAMP-binding protein
VLYAEGEPPKGIYILLRGKVKLSQLNPDGSVQILFIFSAGEIFGHRSILGNDRQPVSASALEECEIMFVEKDFFLELVKRSPRFSEMLMKSISHEFSILVNRINVFAQRGIKERLALFLLLLNETYKVPGQLTEESEITVNRNDLACYTGTSVENLVRTLKTFKENNYIRTNGKSIFITDFAALYNLTGI